MGKRDGNSALTDYGIDALPPFSDDEAVLALFDDEDLNEWASECPRFDDDPPGTVPYINLKWAIRRAEEKNDPTQLIQYAKNLLLKESAPRRVKPVKRPRGRPKGTTVSKSKRLDNAPIHRAASMVPLAQAILKDWYPEQSSRNIYDRALQVVERIWNDRKRVNVEGLAGYLRRSSKDRHRLV